MDKEAKTERMNVAQMREALLMKVLEQNKDVPKEVLENKLKKLAMTTDVKAKAFLDAYELMGGV